MKTSGSTNKGKKVELINFDAEVGQVCKKSSEECFKYFDKLLLWLYFSQFAHLDRSSAHYHRIVVFVVSEQAAPSLLEFPMSLWILRVKSHINCVRSPGKTQIEDQTVKSRQQVILPVIKFYTTRAWDLIDLEQQNSKSEERAYKIDEQQFIILVCLLLAFLDGKLHASLKVVSCVSYLINIIKSVVIILKLVYLGHLMAVVEPKRCYYKREQADEESSYFFARILDWKEMVGLRHIAPKINDYESDDHQNSTRFYWFKHIVSFLVVHIHYHEEEDESQERPDDVNEQAHPIRIHKHSIKEAEQRLVKRYLKQYLVVILQVLKTSSFRTVVFDVEGLDEHET